MPIRGQNDEALACSPLLQLFHGFAGAFRGQSLAQCIHSRIAHHMDRIRRAAFAQQGTAITLSDHKMMTCSPAYLSAVHFRWELPRQISCMLRRIHMPHGNTTVASSHGGKCGGVCVSLHQHQVWIFRLKHSAQTIQQATIKDIHTRPKSRRLKMIVNAYIELFQE